MPPPLTRLSLILLSHKIGAGQRNVGDWTRGEVTYGRIVKWWKGKGGNCEGRAAAADDDDVYPSRRLARRTYRARSAVAIFFSLVSRLTDPGFAIYRSSDRLPVRPVTDTRPSVSRRPCLSPPRPAPPVPTTDSPGLGYVKSGYHKRLPNTGRPSRFDGDRGRSA